MPVTIVEVIHVIAVLNGLMPTILTVGVLRLGVLGLLVVTSHDDLPWTTEPGTGPFIQWSTGISIRQRFRGNTTARITLAHMPGAAQASHALS
ncbi:hypothetical protein [Kocuria sediminis]|uniref:hypothetical protein n=1 Tax=Kocuria sediminis TaxID=1038857 RepID=UPI0019825C12|nr:hypothetical protein [Kocuria sediminis]